MIVKQPTPYNYFIALPESLSLDLEWYTNTAAECS